MNTKTTIAFLFTVLMGSLLLSKTISVKARISARKSHTIDASQKNSSNEPDATDVIDYPGSWIFDLNQ